jgi:hypothetical protein
MTYKVTFRDGTETVMETQEFTDYVITQTNPLPLIAVNVLTNEVGYQFSEISQPTFWQEIKESFQVPVKLYLVYLLARAFFTLNRQKRDKIMDEYAGITLSLF